MRPQTALWGQSFALEAKHCLLRLITVLFGHPLNSLILFSHKPDDDPKKADHEAPPNEMHETDDEQKKKKKKRNEDAFNEISDILTYEDACPILDTLEKRCRGVDVLTGDVHHNLLPACGVHQLCYLCVSKGS